MATPVGSRGARPDRSPPADGPPSSPLPGASAPPAAALVAAARELLADRAPSAITGRELAARAEVPYGLVHRHFGAKSNVLAAALAEMLDEYVTDDYGDDDLPRPLRFSARRPLVRSLAHLMLDRDGFGEYEHTTPAMRRTLVGVQRARPDLDAEERAAVVALCVAIETGLPLHREVIAGGVGLGVDDPAIDQLVTRWLDGLCRGTGPLGARPVALPSTSVRAPSADHDAEPLGDDVPTDVRLVEAGARLVVDRAPSAISGRELARAAGVNYGLVHHYFGSKDEVLRASLQLLRDRYAAATATPGYSPRFFAVCDHTGYVHAMSWGALDASLAVPGMRFPVMAQLVDRLVDSGRQSGAVELATRVGIMVVVAAQLAWALFAPMLECGLGVDPRRLEPLAASLMRELLVDPLGGIDGPG